MKIHCQIPDELIPHPILSMGTFDGVHKGHQQLIQQMVKDAREKNGCAVLITFDPHPKQVLYPDVEPLKMIQTLEEKIDFLKTTGLDHLVILPFTQETSRWSAEDFVRNIFVKSLHANKIYLGYDHRFGKNRTGDFALMQELSNIYHFELNQIPAVFHQESPISSTKIRAALTAGDIELANEMLGHPYSLSGEVLHGKKLGRTIGVPTANIQIKDPNKILPKNGVYFGIAQIEGDPKKYSAAINIGVRPTVDSGDTVHIEAHLISFDQDIYNKRLTLEFINRIRDEKKFDQLEQLVQQITSDIEWVKNFSLL